MKRLSKRVLSSVLTIAMLLSAMSTTAFAAETEESEVYVSNTINSGTENANIVSEVGDTIALASGQKSIYSDIETLIYTGKGVDRWLHITPQLTPNTFTIRMVDYNGSTVWNERFATTGTTHWFVGANVKYVYLKGIPGGVVTVSDTAN